MANSGEIVTLQCEADGIPLPKVVWQKNDIPIDVEDDSRLSQTPGGSLKIQGVLDADSGDYVCLASNKAGTDSRYITFEVRGMTEGSFCCFLFCFYFLFFIYFFIFFAFEDQVMLKFYCNCNTYIKSTIASYKNSK